ncbi:MAG TPA: type II secretion system protein GspE [Desulfotomaculum sp.]|nr:type II secretion system protein GspE [Desulfotomaculum sp.]HBY04997.1 type II secretion system protein GspE [Desulfotomaculum sp.]
MRKRKLLGEKLIEEGLITGEQLDEALRVQTRTGELLGRILIELGMISEDSLNKILGIHKIEPKDEIKANLLKTIPEQLIRKYKMFPIRKEGKHLVVAMADPLNIIAIDDLRLLTGLDIKSVKASEKEINSYIDKYFGLPEVEKVLQELLTEPEIIEQEEIIEEVIVDEAPVIRLVNSLIMKAINEDASDIHIEPFEFSVRVRNRVDGILRDVMTLPRKMVHAVVSRIKIMGSMDIAERRVPQDGRIPLRIAGRELDLRISTMPTVFGEKVVIRILDKGNIKNFTLENLGFGPQNMNYFRKFFKNAHGIILATGPTGSGKTTTLYTALNSINSIERNIVTVEDPVEYMLEGINQSQVNIKAGATFGNYLRSILRQDPDVIMIGEIRDFETAEIAVRAATTGHLVLSTMHTNDAPGAITRLIDMGIEPFMVASSVIGIVAQRLVRKICQNCRQEYTPDKAEIAFAGLEHEDTVYHGAGCEICNHTGYKGRIAIHEVLSVSPSLQNLILQKTSNDELRKAAFIEGMISLKEDGLQKVFEGVTTIKEIIRVAFREE